MKVNNIKWTASGGWVFSPESAKAQLIFVFGDRLILSDAKHYEGLKRLYPDSNIVAASTSGNILGTSIEDHTLIATAITFEKPLEIQLRKTNIREVSSSMAAGEWLGANMPRENLAHVVVLSDGHLVNGSEMLKGLISALPPGMGVTGGLAGDDSRFEQTLVGVNAPPKEGDIVAIGFYSQHLKFGFASVGGWDPFGVERKVTRSKDNILYELDGQPALELYKKYLGAQAKELPSSALFFPLAIRENLQSAPIVRTILNVNEQDKSMIFAGNVPEGWYAQLMKANFDRLIDGAVEAANTSFEMFGKISPDLAILISCVGRRLVLGPRTEEELESVQEIIGKKVPMIGFYSYGEIAPQARLANCELHNQTMTITLISEV